jgi:arabinofuranosyltransferase
MNRELLRSDRPLVLLGTLAALLFYAVFIARTGFVVGGEVYFTLFDDAMISMRYARNLADGYGLVWNPGEAPVEGYTNLLWTLWMAFLHVLPLSESKIALGVMISGALILIANVGIVHRIAVRLADGSPLVPVFVVFLVALYYPLVYWTLRGMEVGLLALVVSAAIWQTLELRERFSRRRLSVVVALLAVGLLIRPDALIPCLAIAAFVLAFVPRPELRRSAVTLAAVLLAVVLGHLLFRLWYYGAPLPNTYYLKVTGVSWSDRVDRGLALAGRLSVFHLFVPLLLAVSLGRRLLDPRLALLAAVFAAQCAYFVYVGGDPWEMTQHADRYVTLVMPALLILSALGAAHLGRMVAATHRKSPGVIVILAVGLWAVGVFWLAGTSTPPDLFGRYSLLRLLSGTGLIAGGAMLLLVAYRASAGIPTAIAVVLVALAFLQLNGEALKAWSSHAGVAVQRDVQNSRLGLAVRETTPAHTSIAVTWAGAIPYFSQRPAIDLLGKSDPVIARTSPRPIFIPGHNKWDYQYSIGVLRPDLILQLWSPTPEDLEYIRESGYDPLEDRPDTVWVRAGSAIDRAALRAALLAIR